MAPIGNNKEESSSFSSSNNNNDSKEVRKGRDNTANGEKISRNKKVLPSVKEKSADPNGETVPGWTIMRPLKMGRLKGKNAPVASAREVGSAGSDSRDLKASTTNDTGATLSGAGEIEVLSDVRSLDGLLGNESPSDATNTHHNHNSIEEVERTNEGQKYRAYKRRWFGLIQLVLLNIVVSWDVSCFFSPQTSFSASLKSLDATIDADACMNSGSPSRPTPRQPRHITVYPQRLSTG